MIDFGSSSPRDLGAGFHPGLERESETERIREKVCVREFEFPLKKTSTSRHRKEATLSNAPPAGTGSLSQRRAPAALPETSAHLRALPSSRAVFFFCVCERESLRPRSR